MIKRIKHTETKVEGRLGWRDVAYNKLCGIENDMIKRVNVFIEITEIKFCYKGSPRLYVKRLSPG